MSMYSRIDESQKLRIDQVRTALGAITADEPAVFWVYLDGVDRWCLRREGAPGETKFSSRRMCFDSLVVEIARRSSFRLFIQGRDGRIHEEHFNWQPAL